ncbi:MAG: energy transducer TonB [Gemmatimonadota bacterium]|jgi:protein TonB
MNARTRTGIAVAWALASLGCADTPRAAGGLQLGVDDAPLRPPTRIDDGAAFEYPTDAWDEGVGGTTVLKLLISKRGTVESAVVVESSGSPSLDSAALANVTRLRYRPAAQGGSPVEVWGRLPVIFPVPGEGETEPHVGP